VLASADEVVVCSTSLRDRKQTRVRVTLIPNAVDSINLRAPRTRPADLPSAPTAVYIGTLHESRLDIELVIELARYLPSVDVVLVGPDALGERSRRRLTAESNVRLLGRRPYAAVPAYLQHADVLIVPHLVNDFTESLDPIKAYESLASGTPTIATPVAGFRELAPAVTVAPADAFPGAVAAQLANPRADAPILVPTWEQRVDQVEEVIRRVWARQQHADANR
jgi:glycosyltransferase involved in cell wall biosynthesis